MAAAIRTRNLDSGLHTGVEVSSPSRELTQNDILPPSPSKEPVLLKSNLHKKGKRFKIWHQRYFEVQGRSMYYYKNSNKNDCLGEIDLSLCFDCSATTEATFGAPFEIRTTLRTHVLSARSPEDRDLWIQIIRKQMNSYEHDMKSGEKKPKRWETFKNAFAVPRRRHQKQQNSETSRKTKIKKRKTFMEKFRSRRAPLRRREDLFEKENRPLSLDDDLPINRLEVMLDAKPSHSLPASPLTQKREKFNLPESPIFTDPEMSLPFSAVVTTPTEINTEQKSSHEIQIALSSPPRDNSMVLDIVPAVQTPTALIEKETVTPVPVPVIVVAENDPVPVKVNSDMLLQPSQDVSIFDTESDIKPNMDDFVPNCEVINREFTWDVIKEVLEESDKINGISVHNISYDILPEEEQVWMQESCGIEQLRAFLAVCD